MARDLTKGSLTKNLLFMSLPTMFGFLSQTLYDIVDIAWIGRLSPGAVASVTIFSSIFWLAEILNEIIGTSSVSLISQSYGAKNLVRASRAVEQTLAFKAFVATIAALFLLLFIKPILGFFAPDASVTQKALEYGYIRIFFLPIMFSSYSVNTALRCIGDAKTPMVIMFVASITNMILDPIFMFQTVPLLGFPGLNLGIFGAGLATVISTTLAFCLGFWVLFSGKSELKLSFRGLFRLDKELDRKLITIGLPTGFEMLFRNLSGLVLLKFVAGFGTAVVATMGIGQRLMGFAFMPLIGLLMGGSTVAGQNLGVDKVDRVQKTAWITATTGMVLMLVFVFFIVLFPENIMRIFVQDQEVIRLGIPMLRIVFPSFIILGFSFGFGTVFSASGLNTPFLISSVISRWLVQVPLLALFIGLWKLPEWSLWVAFCVAESLEGCIIIWFYSRGKWKTKRV